MSDEKDNSSKILDQHRAWLEYRDVITEEERRAAAESIQKWDASAPEGLLGLQMDLMGMIIDGSMSPVTAEMVLKIMKEAQTTLMITLRQHGADESIGEVTLTQVTTQLRERVAQIKAVKPQYTIAPKPDVPELTASDTLDAEPVKRIMGDE